MFLVCLLLVILVEQKMIPTVHHYHMVDTRHPVHHREVIVGVHLQKMMMKKLTDWVLKEVREMIQLLFVNITMSSIFIMTIITMSYNTPITFITNNHYIHHHYWYLYHHSHHYCKCTISFDHHITYCYIAMILESPLIPLLFSLQQFRGSTYMIIFLCIYLFLLKN